MAHNLPYQQPQNLPQPDFVVVKSHLDGLGTQLSRLANIPAAQQDGIQQILARLDTIDGRLDAIEIRLTSIETRAENERLRKQNAHRLAMTDTAYSFPSLIFEPAAAAMTG